MTDKGIMLLNRDTDLDSLRKDKKYREMMRRYFGE